MVEHGKAEESKVEETEEIRRRLLREIEGIGEDLRRLREILERILRE